MTDRGYERISLDNERSGSLSKQTSRIDAFGHDVVHYPDRTVSGSKIKFAARPEGGRLLADLRPGDRVLVTKIDRAARNVRDLLDLVERIEKIGASIVFIDQNIDTSGPIGKFILVLLAAIAELEANIIGERRRESLAAFSKEGRHAVGAAPFGFASVDNPNGRGLVIRPDWEYDELLGTSPAERLRDAIERVLRGEPQARVVESLPIKPAGFSILLRNPRLAGMTPAGDGVVMVDGAPRIDPEAALLSMTEWSRLREHMKRPNPKPWIHQDGYGAALICEACGFRLYKSKGGTARPNNIAYKCGRAKHERGTPSASVMTAGADQYVERLFLERYGDRRVVEAYWSSSADLKVEAIATAQVMLDAAQQAFLADLDDVEEEAALDQLRAAKKELRAAKDLPEDRVYRTEETGETVREVWERSDAGERCRLLKLVGSWVVRPGRLPIEEKIVLRDQERALELELLTHAHGSESLEHDDQGTLLIPAV